MITRAPGSDKTHPCRVLIVEDHVDTRDLLVRLLSDAYDVRTAGCYESALTAAAEAPPQVVIADVRLPGKDGVELMRELRQRYQVPGIAVTGQIAEDPDLYRNAGFVACLTKPIHFDQLLEALNQTCSARMPA